jgi:hypothetical protein
LSIDWKKEFPMKETHESFLPLPTLLFLLREQQETGSLHAQVGVLHTPGGTIRGMTRIHLTIEQGCPRSCTIRHRGRVILEGPPAWDAVSTCNGERWSLALAPRPVGRPSTPGPRTPIPVRTRTLAPYQMQTFSRHQRAVWLLVNGKRTSDEIATLLVTVDRDEIDHLLRQLNQLALITFKEERPQ